MKRVLILTMIIVGLLFGGNLMAQKEDIGPGPTKAFGKKISDPSILKPGNPVQILWDGKWWLGSVVKVLKNGQVKIHYYGWEYKYDEVVDLKRLLLITKSPGAIKPNGQTVTAKTPLKPGDGVQVKWKGSWYLGTVLVLLDGGKVKIHYYGWSHEYDEVVTRDRLKIIPLK